jgi:predicted lysophospholipase L1 biosynthesis ABC-type transport system permease subunit
VVGTGLVSTETTEQYAGAAYLSRAGFEGLTDGAFYESVVVRYADGADRASEWQRFDARYPAGVQDESSPTPPAAVSQLHQLGSLRDALAAVFAMLFLAITATTLGVAGHRSRRPLAVLRCLGHTVGQSRAVLLSAAGCFAAFTVVAGAAVGTLAGTALWRRLTGRLHVLSIVGLPYGWAVLSAVAVVSAGSIAVFVAGGRHAHQPPARSLRAE